MYLYNEGGLIMKKALLIIILMAFVLSINAMNQFTLPNSDYSLKTTNWRMSSLHFQEYENSIWMNRGKYDFYYNANHPSTMDSVLQYEYQNNSYILNASVIFYYDENFEYINQVNAYDYTTGNRLLSMQANYVYNNDQHLIHAYVFEKPIPTADLMCYNRLHIIINGEQIQNVYMWEYDEESESPYYSKMDFTFDNAGRIIEEIDNLSSDSTSWVPGYKMLRTYHPQDPTTGEIFNDNFSHQYPLFTFLFGDGDPTFGMLTETIEQRWENNIWLNESKENTTYDENLNPISQIRYNWIDGAWANDYQKINTYNTDNNMIHVLEQYWSGSEWVDNFQVALEWESYTGNNDITEIPSKLFDFNAYPNPFKNDLTIKVNNNSSDLVKVEIFNIKGQKVYKSLEPSNQDINIHNSLSSGIYFLRLSNNSDQKTRKILILK